MIIQKSKYLAYGSNMLSLRLQARVSSAANPKVVQLKGWKLDFSKKSIDGSGKCDVFKSQNDDDSVWAVLYDLDESQLPELDRFEGKDYKRDRIEVATSEGVVSAWVYKAKSEHTDPNLRPYAWYSQLILSGAEEHSLPAYHVELLRSFGSINDVNPDRPERLKAEEILKKYEDLKKI